MNLADPFSGRRPSRLALLALAVGGIGGCNALFGFEEGTPAPVVVGGAAPGGSAQGGSVAGGHGGTGGQGATGGTTTLGGGGAGGGGGSGLCQGDPTSGDTDGDGVCDSDDLCPGDQDHVDGTCSTTFTALTDPNESGTLLRYDDVPGALTCPLVDATSTETNWHTDAVWEIRRRWSSITVPRNNEVKGFLSFDTTPLDDLHEVQWATLRIQHAFSNTSGDVHLYGGTQPIFGGQLQGNDFDNGTTLLDTETMASIQQQSMAEFNVAGSQVQLDG